jgi:hypothetical protein
VQEKRFALKFLSPVLAVAVLSLISTSAHAQIAQWAFTGNVLSPTTLLPTVTATSISNASLISFGASGNLLNAAPANGATGGNNDLPSAISANSYFQFTVTPNIGQSMSISSVGIDAGFGNNASFAIRSSLDSFAANIGTQTNLSATLAGFSYSVSGNPAFQNITSATTFRVYLHGANNNQTMNFDNVSINGATVAIPEPGSVALLALGASGLVLRRRRA